MLLLFWLAATRYLPLGSMARSSTPLPPVAWWSTSFRPPVVGVDGEAGDAVMAGVAGVKVQAARVHLQVAGPVLLVGHPFGQGGDDLEGHVGQAGHAVVEGVHRDGVVGLVQHVGEAAAGVAGDLPGAGVPGQPAGGVGLGRQPAGAGVEGELGQRPGAQVGHEGELVAGVDRQPERPLAGGEGLGRVQGAIGLDGQHRHVAAAPVGDQRVFARGVQRGPGGIGPAGGPAPGAAAPRSSGPRRTTAPGPAGQRRHQHVALAVPGQGHRRVPQRLPAAMGEIAQTQVQLEDWMSPPAVPTYTKVRGVGPCAVGAGAGCRAAQPARTVASDRGHPQRDAHAGRHIRSRPPFKPSVEQADAGVGGRDLVT